MVVLVIGLGSMGKRRIRLIRQYNKDYEILGADLNEERRIQAEKQFCIKTYEDFKIALESKNINCAFIATAPLSHCSIIKTCLENSIHVFTELNLVADGYEQNIALSEKTRCQLFLSSTFLYRREIQYIQKMAGKLKSRLHYNYHVGQYLPDWHPWENYNDFFVGNVQTNGCREIFAIELPWLVQCFGEISKITVKKDKITDLNINYMDSYLLILEHCSGHMGIVSVDVVSRKAVRNLEIYGEELYLSWDGSPHGLYHYNWESKENVKINLYNKIDGLEDYSEQIIENMYYSEIANFFDVLAGKDTAKYSFEKDKKILGIIDSIENR